MSAIGLAPGPIGVREADRSGESHGDRPMKARYLSCSSPGTKRLSRGEVGHTDVHVLILADI